MLIKSCGDFSEEGEYKAMEWGPGLDEIFEWPQKMSADENSLLEKYPPGWMVANLPDDTPLISATKMHDLLEMKECLKRDSDAINEQDNRGFTALHHAAKDGFMEGLKLLLEHHCKVDVLNVLGLTPLMIAIISAEFELANQLLDAGASPYHLTLENESPITIAAKMVSIFYYTFVFCITMIA